MVAVWIPPALIHLLARMEPDSGLGIPSQAEWLSVTGSRINIFSIGAKTQTTSGLWLQVSTNAGVCIRHLGWSGGKCVYIYMYNIYISADIIRRVGYLREDRGKRAARQSDEGAGVEKHGSQTTLCFRPPFRENVENYRVVLTI